MKTGRAAPEKTLTLKNSGDACVMMPLAGAHLTEIKDLHDLVREHLPPAEKSFILPRTVEYFERHFTRGPGNIILGIYCRDLLVAKSVIVHPAPDAVAADLGGAILTTPPEKTSILQAATVHPDYQGQGLMQAMVEEWIDHARAHEKSHVMAEIEIHNHKSWSTFLKIGLNIVRLGRSPVDGAEIYSAQERIKYGMTKDLSSLSQPQHDDIVECAITDIESQKNLMDDGYHVIAHDRARSILLLKKRVKSD